MMMTLFNLGGGLKIYPQFSLMGHPKGTSVPLVLGGAHLLSGRVFKSLFLLGRPEIQQSSRDTWAS